jgi:hypothetical protein
MNKNNCAPLGQYNVRLSWEIGTAEFHPESQPPYCIAHDLLWRCVPATNA